MRQLQCANSLPPKEPNKSERTHELQDGCKLPSVFYQARSLMRCGRLLDFGRLDGDLGGQPSAMSTTSCRAIHFSAATAAAEKSHQSSPVLSRSHLRTISADMNMPELLMRSFQQPPSAAHIDHRARRLCAAGSGFRRKKPGR